MERVLDDSVACEVCGLTPVIGVARRFSRLVAESAAMQEVLRRAGRFAQTDAPLVIRGESGTGKEIIARAIHASSTHGGAPFVAVNVAALPSELLESELFGHARGAFTGAHQSRQGLFESAAGGTLFLDEIGELQPSLQAKLLRALQDGEIRRVGETRSFSVDTRVICATHRDLNELVARGDFREDLFYRISVLTLMVPPLRARRDDILPLAREMLLVDGTPSHRLSPEAQAILLSHSWPGNVRELENALRHGAALATKDIITAADLPAHLGASTPDPRRSTRMCSLAEMEREHVLGVLAACDGSVVEAARILEIGRNTLWRKLKSWG